MGYSKIMGQIGAKLSVKLEVKMGDKLETIKFKYGAATSLIRGSEQFSSFIRIWVFGRFTENYSTENFSSLSGFQLKINHCTVTQYQNSFELSCTVY